MTKRVKDSPTKLDILSKLKILGALHPTAFGTSKRCIDELLHHGVGVCGKKPLKR